MSAVALQVEGLGRVVAEYSCRVSTEAVSRYAAATGRPDQSFHPGASAPPLFGVVPARRGVLAALRSVVPEEVGLRVPVLHGEQDVTLHRALRCEETVDVRSSALGIQQKSSGCVVLLGTELFSRGELVEQQRMVVFLPGASGVADLGVQPTPLPLVRPGGEALRTPTLPDQSRLYAAVSGDDTAFHVDDVAARGYGFPGVIMHGLCTLATVLADLVPALGREATDLRRVAARFAAPALPGHDLHTRYGSVGASVEFTSTDGGGRPVLERGRVELA